jgi:hypothetical protein
VDRRAGRAWRSEFGFPFVLATFFHSEFGLAFRFIGSVYDAQRSKGTQAWILSFLEIEIGEVLFISFPEEIIKSVDEDPDFPGSLNFLLGSHFFSFLC